MRSRTVRSHVVDLRSTFQPADNIGCLDARVDALSVELQLTLQPTAVLINRLRRLLLTHRSLLVLFCFSLQLSLILSRSIYSAREDNPGPRPTFSLLKA